MVRITNFSAIEVVDDSFVGLIIKDNKVEFRYPVYYHFETTNFDKDDVLDLLRTIAIAKTPSRLVEDSLSKRRNYADYAFNSYVWIIEDFLKNGLYQDKEKLYKYNQPGKINWKKTLQQKGLLSKDHVFFPRIVNEVRSNRENKIGEIHRYCIWKSIHFLGWLYGLDELTIEKPFYSSILLNEYLNTIQQELDNSYNDDKRQLLSHMKDVLIGLDETGERESIVFGVDSYHYIFERLVDSVFGSENTENYNPTFSWTLKYPSEKSNISGPTMRPDSILRHEGNIYIIDSKFYRYGSSLDYSYTNGLPEANSITKQILYGSYVKEKVGNGIGVYNAFILPYDSQSETAKKNIRESHSFIYVGNVQSDWKKEETYSTIHTFLIDLRYLIHEWQNTSHEQDRRIFCEEILKSCNSNESAKVDSGQ